MEQSILVQCLNTPKLKTGNDIAQEIMRYSDFRIDNSTPKLPYINTMLFITENNV